MAETSTATTVETPETTRTAVGSLEPEPEPYSVAMLVIHRLAKRAFQEVLYNNVEIQR